MPSRRRQLASTFFCLTAVVASALAQSPQTAISQFTQLNREAAEAKKSNDTTRLISVYQRLSTLLSNSAASQVRLANAYARAGDRAQPLAALLVYVIMGQSDETILAFLSLAEWNSTPEFAGLKKRMAENSAPITRSVTFAKLQDPGLVVEDIDFDPPENSFYITSVREKKNRSDPRERHPAGFCLRPGQLAHAGHPTRRESWMHLGYRGGAQRVHDRRAKRLGPVRSALVCFDRHTGRVLRRIEGPPKSVLGDMVLLSNGDLLVSDGADGGGVYRVAASQPLDSTTLERIDAGDFISPQTPAPGPNANHVFVPDYARGIAS